jgi:anti-sigma-K factor RskA
MPSLTMPADTNLHELVAAYALDALDDDDREAFEQHLGSCQRCADELAGLRETAAALAYATPSAPPPPELRDRILESARAERPNVVPLRPRWVTPALGAATAVAALVALGLGIWGVSISHSLDDERAARKQTEQTIASIADADAVRRALSGAQGSLVVSQSGKASLVVCSLGKAPAGKTYEAWVIAGGTPVRAATFEGGRVCSVVPLTHMVSPDATVAVTVEQDGGVDKPTSTPIIQSMPA